MERGPVGSLVSPEHPDEYEQWLGPDGVAVFVHRRLLETAEDPLNVSFAFGPLGRCRVTLSPPKDVA